MKCITYSRVTSFLFGTLLLLMTCLLHAKTPNVLLITVDDMGYDTPGCFGGAVEDITPNIDQLASEGMRFNKAHVYVAVCQPSRQSMMTGRYNHRIGALGFSPIDENITTLQEILDEAGYINGILGKVTHLRPYEKYRWSYKKLRAEMGYGRDAEQYYADTTAFIQMAKDQGKPFFLMANSHDPHRPFHGSPSEKRHFGEKLPNIKQPSRIYTPDEIVVPGFLPDLPGVRNEMSFYFSSCKRADDTVGSILKALKDAGHQDDTLVMFMSDNGMPVATAKWNTYVQGTRTPWIVRWPGVVKPGTVDRDHFICGVDYMPTILEAIGLDVPDGLNGQSFLPLLKGGQQEDRDHIFTAHYQWIHYYGNKEARKEILEKMVREKGYRYKDEWNGLIKDMHIRCLQDDRYAYIYNPWSDGKNEYYAGYVLTRAAMNKAAKTDPAIKKRLDFIRYRVPEEFYDLHKDPHSLTNLIDDPKHADRIAEMRGRMLAWMERNEDPITDGYRNFISTP